MLVAPKARGGVCRVAARGGTPGSPAQPSDFSAPHPLRRPGPTRTSRRGWSGSRPHCCSGFGGARWGWLGGWLWPAVLLPLLPAGPCTSSHLLFLALDAAATTLPQVGWRDTAGQPMPRPASLKQGLQPAARPPEFAAADVWTRWGRLGGRSEAGTVAGGGALVWRHDAGLGVCWCGGGAEMGQPAAAPCGADLLARSTLPACLPARSTLPAWTPGPAESAVMGEHDFRRFPPAAVLYLPAAQDCKGRSRGTSGQQTPRKRDGAVLASEFTSRRGSARCDRDAYDSPNLRRHFSNIQVDLISYIVHQTLERFGGEYLVFPFISPPGVSIHFIPAAKKGLL